MGFLSSFICQFVFVSLVNVPTLTSPVMDEAQILKSDERQALADFIFAHQAKAQVQVWTLPSLEGESIEGLSIRAAEKWKLGTEKADNGIIIIVALKERQMRVEVGQGLEGLIPDVLAGRLIDNVLKPAFRQGAYADGLQLAIRQLLLWAGDETVESGETEEGQALAPQPKFRGLDLLILLLAFICFPIVISLMGALGMIPRSNRWSRGYGSGPVIWGGGGRGGGGWSGGGGGFSGGGASGSW